MISKPTLSEEIKSKSRINGVQYLNLLADGMESIGRKSVGPRLGKGRQKSGDLPDESPDSSIPTLRRFSKYNKPKSDLGTFRNFPSVKRQNDGKVGGAQDGEERRRQKAEPRGAFRRRDELEPLTEARTDREESLKLIVEEMPSVASRKLLFETHQSKQTPKTPQNTLSKLTSSKEMRPRPSREAENWLLSEKGPDLPSSSVNAGNITVIGLSGEQESGSSLRIPVDGHSSMSLKTKKLTCGRLGLSKSSSLMNCLEQADGPPREEYPLRKNSSRKPVYDIFDTEKTVSQKLNIDVSDPCCCHCSGQKSQGVCPLPALEPLATSSPLPKIHVLGQKHLDSPEKLEFTAFFPETSSENHSSRSQTPTSSNSFRSSTRDSPHFQSCPDLLEPCLQGEWQGRRHEEPGSDTRPPPSWSTFGGRARKAKAKRRAADWQYKPLAEWSLDDILLWLQHIHMDDVASILIGYELSGKDVENWDESALEIIGILDYDTQKRLLNEVKRLKEQPLPTRPRRSAAGSKQPLFNLVRAASFDQILAMELELTSRDLSVAEGGQGGLYVTRVNPCLGLQEGDCILEVNNQPVQTMAAVDFTKHLSRCQGQAVKLVVLRRREERPASAPLQPPIPFISLSGSLSSQDLPRAFASTVDAEADFHILHF